MPHRALPSLEAAFSLTELMKRASAGGVDVLHTPELAELVRSPLSALTEVGGAICRALVREPGLGSVGRVVEVPLSLSSRPADGRECLGAVPGG